MGYTRHHAIVVTTYSAGHADRAHRRAVDVFEGLAPVGPVMRSYTNAWLSFTVYPDGSKEGWGASDAGDVAREVFVQWLDSQRFPDGSSPWSWAVIRYGDDEGDTRVEDHSDEPERCAPPVDAREV